MFDFYSQMNAIAANQKAINTHFKNLQKFSKIGYKAHRTTFSELYSNAIGTGALKESENIIFTQGRIKEVKIKTYMAINGNGFFVISDGNKTLYTRAGDFKLKDGVLVHPETGFAVQGYAIDPRTGKPDKSKLVDIKLSYDPNTKLYLGKYNDYEIADDGIVYGIMKYTDPITGKTVTKKEPIYQVALANFTDPSRLHAVTDTAFEPTKESGDPVYGVAGEGTFGRIKSKALEMSNVSFIEEAMEGVFMKMNYEANMAAFRVMNSMIKSATQLIR